MISIASYFSRYFYPLRASYLLGPTICLILGIWWFVTGFNGLLITLYIIAMALLGTVNPPKKVIITALFLPLGAFLAYRQHQSFETFHKHHQEKAYTIRGTITDKGSGRNWRYPYATTIYTTQIKSATNDTWIPCGKNIVIYTATPLDQDIMDDVEIKNISLKKPQRESFVHYLIRNNIGSSCFITKNDVSLIQHPAYSLKRWLHHLREKIRAQFQQKLSPTTYTLFTTIFLGFKDNQNKKLEPIKEDFKTWGISHHLARSGLHLVVLLLLLELLFRYIPLRYTTKNLLMLLLVGIYALLSWPTVSFIRALLTFILYKLCILLTLSIDLLHLVTLICFVTLLVNPYHLFFLDFQLSFGLTFAIAWLNHTLSIKSRL